MEQIYAVANETIKNDYRVKDDPTLFGIWNALETRIIATSSEEFRSGMSGGSSQGGHHSSRMPSLGREDGMQMASCSEQGTTCVGRMFAIMGEKHAEVLNDPDASSRATACRFRTVNRVGSSTKRLLRGKAASVTRCAFSGSPCTGTRTREFCGTSTLVSGHALHEKGLQRQKGAVPLVGSQEERALLVPLINRG